MPDEPEKTQEVTRRRFFTILGTGSLLTSVAGGTVLSAQFLSPNVLYEPPAEFPVGGIDDFNRSSVTLLPKHKVFIIRAQEGFYSAISAICTHLGCIANWDPERKLIACPCHGSLFAIDGSVLQGPAPRPLPRFRIYQGRDTRLWVDSMKTVEGNDVLKT